MAIIDRRGIVVDDSPSSAGSFIPSANLAIKTPCRVVATGNVTLSGLQTIDGVTVIEDDRVLVAGQSSAVDNGIYTASSGNWQRTTDFDSPYETVEGTQVYINEGTVGAGRSYVVTSNDPIIPGTSSLTFVVMQTEAEFVQPTSYPVSVTSGHKIPYLDSDAQFGNAYSQYPLGSVSTNPIIIGKAASTIGSATVGQTFKIVFTSAGLSGSPITITYTAVGGDTVDTIAAGLAALVNANTVLHGTGGKPIFMQAAGSGGSFNLQYDSAFSVTGATPLTTATTGSTGTITLASETNALDFAVMQLGRNATGHTGKAGDALYALDFTGQDSTGTFNTHYGIMSVQVTAATAGATRATMAFSTAGNAGPIGRFGLNTGAWLYDATGALPSGGDLGPGTFNIPTVGKFSIDNVNNIRRSSVSNQFIIEATNSDSIVLGIVGGGIGLNATPTGQTATSGLGFFVSGVQVPTTGSGISLTGGATSVLSAKNYATTTRLPLAVDTSALTVVTGAGTLTVPAVADTLVGKATTDVLTNKTFDTAGSGNVLSVASVNIATTWATYTPTITSTGGTPTTTSGSGRYKQVGKTVHLELFLTLTTVGTATGQVIATLPVACRGDHYIGTCLEVATTAKTGSAYISSAAPTLIKMVDYNNGTFWVNGYSLVVCCTYEIT